MALLCSWQGNIIDWSATGSLAQAVFTALAIIGAFVVATRQHKLQVKEASRQTYEARMGRLSAVEGEIRYCMMQCGVYVAFYFSENLSSPAYRLPQLAHDRTLPLILADGLLTSDDMEAVTQFYVDALSFNRCLDNLEFFSQDSSPEITSGTAAYFRSSRINNEKGRTVSKALHLVPLNSEVRASIPEKYRTVASRAEAALAAIEHARSGLVSERNKSLVRPGRWYHLAEHAAE